MGVFFYTVLVWWIVILESDWTVSLWRKSVKVRICKQHLSSPLGKGFLLWTVNLGHNVKVTKVWFSLWYILRYKRTVFSLGEELVGLESNHWISLIIIGDWYTLGNTIQQLLLSSCWDICWRPGKGVLLLSLGNTASTSLVVHNMLFILPSLLPSFIPSFHPSFLSSFLLWDWVWNHGFLLANYALYCLN
jgi:hypothetical protein